MADDESIVKPVLPIIPVTMNRTRRIEPFGAEERYPYYKYPKRPAKKELIKQATEKCIVTVEEVDCKV